METNNLLMNKENVNTKKTVKTKAKTASKKVAEKPLENCSVEASGELLNTSELSLKYGIDRAIVRKRLQLALIEPHSTKVNEKVYLVTEDLEDALLDEGNPELDAARLRKLTVESELKEMDLKVKRGEFASVYEFTEVVQKIFGSMYRKCVTQQPKPLAKRLAKTRNEAQMAEIITAEYNKIFQELRKDYSKFLK